MGLLSRLLVKNYTMEDFNRDIREWISGRPTLAGVQVNEQSAMRYVTVYSCVRVLAETLASLPLFVYRERPGGGSDKARDHPVYGLLHDLPNDEMTSLTWRETQMGHLALSGNCYAIITHNRRGQPIDLYPVGWHYVTPLRNPETEKIEYHVNDRGKIETFPAEKVFHIPGLGYDGIRGYSPIRMAQEAIGLGLAATEFAARFYGQGMNIGGVLEHPGALSEKAKEHLRKSLEERGAGLANSWKPLILEEGMKWARIPMPMTDAQFVETRKLNRDEICGLFRVPPHMIANLERSTFSNIEMQSLEFVMYTMLPWIKRWEQTINWKLFTRQEREQGYYAKFNVTALLRGDAKSRAQALHIMRQDGIINADEWREMEEMNPIEDGSGKVYLINGNMIPISSAGQQQDQQNQKQERQPMPSPFKRLQNTMTPEEWEEEYEEGTAHWAEDLQPSIFAQRFVERLRQEEITGSLLEIGCGNGRDSIFFARAGFNVTAVDVAPSALELAKENAKDAGVEINFVEANAEELPFADGQFNAVFSLSVLHASDMTKSIPETARVLATGGLFSVYIYGTTENVNGTTEVHITIDDYISLLKNNNYEILDFYSEQEEEYDEAGERHQIIVALCRRLEGG